MLSNVLLTIHAAVCAGPGVVLLVAPGALMSVYGMALEMRGAFMGRLLGSVLVGLAWVFWRARTTPDASMRTTVLWVSVLINALQAAIILTGVIGGLLNALGWSALGLHVVLATAFLISRGERGNSGW